uniref:Reverse transcriptase domain-containing protein n=1 Tax=Elaeophora elaphi TaxID=1147741 RepID=A0A0R3S762_9BILA
AILFSSSPGGTPGPFGRIQQKRDFNDIASEINKLKRADRSLKTNQKEINELMEMMKSKLSSKLPQANLNEQTQSNIHPITPFERQEQQLEDKQVISDEALDLTKSKQLSLNDENDAVNLSVKQRAQMFEAVAAYANKPIALAHTSRFVSKHSSESRIQNKKRRTATPMPKYRKTITKVLITD